MSLKEIKPDWWVPTFMDDSKPKELSPEDKRKKHAEYERMRRIRDKDKIKVTKKRYYIANKEKIHARNREYYKDDKERAKLAVFTHYGGNPPKCNCCGETILDFLSIDHINGYNGAGPRGGWFLYRRLIKLKFPQEFQVLCHNCNWAKGLRGKCPHQNKNDSL